MKTLWVHLILVLLMGSAAQAQSKPEDCAQNEARNIHTKTCRVQKVLGGEAIFPNDLSVEQAKGGPESIEGSIYPPKSPRLERANQLHDPLDFVTGHSSGHPKKGKGAGPTDAIKDQ